MKLQKLSFIIILVLLSCSVFKPKQTTKPNYADDSHRDKSNYKNFYIVDTILISNPKLIIYRADEKDRYMILITESQFAEKVINMTADEVVATPYVFFSGGNFMGLGEYKWLNPKFIYVGDDEGTLLKKGKYGTIYEFDNPPSHFLLLLVNINFFRWAHSSLPPIYLDIPQTPLYKSAYIKAVIPMARK